MADPLPSRFRRLPHRFLALCIFIACIAPLVPSSRADEKEKTSAARALDIRPQKPDAWKASLPDVKAVLFSAAGELWKQFPDRKLDPILVEPRGGPITLFRRGKAGEYFVRLNTGEKYWAQYAYQFAHEMCHILCGYREGEDQNKWFEESLCELASLYALRQMSETWKTHPPYANWKSYAPALADYAKDRMSKGKLGEGVTLAAWYREHADQLKKNPTQRELNEVVSIALLPLFEKEPEHWEAVTWLNAGELVKDRNFHAYLSAWHDNVPAKHKSFVEAIVKELGVKLGEMK